MAIIDDLDLSDKPESAERTLKSLATMLGWANVPPRETLERSVNALKATKALNYKERERLEALEEAAKTFCAKVDAGMARSFRSYNEFKRALEIK